MKTVFIVHRGCEVEGGGSAGVFSSREKALEAIAEMTKPYHQKYDDSEFWEEWRQESDDLWRKWSTYRMGDEPVEELTQTYDIIEIGEFVVDGVLK